MFSTIRNFCLCFVTLLCTADGDIRNSSTSDPSVIITSVNDSAFLLSRPNESKHEYKNKDLDWILKPSTLNNILEYSHPENSEVFPHRKREIMLTKLTNPLGTFTNESKFTDNLYTVYFNDNTNASDHSLLRRRKQAGNDYYNKELDKLDDSNTGDEVKIPISPLVSLRGKTPKTIKDNSRLEITVPPMPILGNDTNKLTESVKVAGTVIETDNGNFNSSKVSLEAIEKSKEKTTASAETIYKTEQTDFLPEIFTDKNEFHINTPKSLEEDTTEEDIEKYFKMYGFIPAKLSESLTTNKMVIEESTPKSVILESEKLSDNWFTNLKDNTNIHLQNRYENNISNDFLTSTNDTNFKLENETRTNDTIDELEYETSTNSSIYDLELSVTNDTLYSNLSNTTKSIVTTAAVPSIFLIGNQDEDYSNNNSDFKLDGSSTSGIDVDRKQSYTSIPTVPTSSKGKLLDAKTENNYMIRGEKSTATSFTSISRTSDLPFSEVKIIPVRAREYTILMAGIILCCVGVVLIIGVLIIFFYSKKKTTSNDVEMVSSVMFGEE